MAELGFAQLDARAFHQRKSSGSQGSKCQVEFGQSHRASFDRKASFGSVTRIVLVRTDSEFD